MLLQASRTFTQAVLVSSVGEAIPEVEERGEAGSEGGNSYHEEEVAQKSMRRV